MITKKYTVDRIVDGRKVVLLDREDEGIQVVMDITEIPLVKEGDIVSITWAKEVGSAAYTIVLQDETVTTRERIQEKLNRLKNCSKST